MGAPIHTTDEQCDVDPATDCCRVCGVYHGDPCADCGGTGFHHCRPSPCGLCGDSYCGTVECCEQPGCECSCGAPEGRYVDAATQTGMYDPEGS